MLGSLHVAAFRLFSTQKTPQAVVIREKEGWDAVKDPRIRCALDASLLETLLISPSLTEMLPTNLRLS